MLFPILISIYFGGIDSIIIVRVWAPLLGERVGATLCPRYFIVTVSSQLSLRNHKTVAIV